MTIQYEQKGNPIRVAWLPNKNGNLELFINDVKQELIIELKKANTIVGIYKKTKCVELIANII